MNCTAAMAEWGELAYVVELGKSRLSRGRKGAEVDSRGPRGYLVLGTSHVQCGSDGRIADVGEKSKSKTKTPKPGPKSFMSRRRTNNDILGLFVHKYFHCL